MSNIMSIDMRNIGKGWPHYLKTPTNATPHTPEQNNIIQTLSPIVTEMLNRFGQPATQNELTQLTNEVIAAAMEIPQVADSMRTAEMTPWGRAPLLQTVVELLILYSKGENICTQQNSNYPS